MAQLLQLCESAKKRLSSQTKAHISADLGPNKLRFQQTFTRAEFEHLNRLAFEDCMTYVDVRTPSESFVHPVNKNGPDALTQSCQR